MKASEIASEAALALANRAEIRDNPNGERSAAKAADIMTAWTGKEYTASDIWRTLMAVKMARSLQGKFHADDFIDLAGYAALLGECEAELNE
jgi:hypothetical protein